mmetsp:Transcript_3069/g.9396  ORF Transcript_3069/g.9396 Transcript_3069/m.9396 type:complete len:702 (+) Transcript_3069:298-2403(+)
MNDAANIAHTQVRMTTARMKRECDAVNKAAAACDKYRQSLQQTIQLASAFHRAMSGLTGTLTMNVSHIKDHSARMRDFTEMLKDDNVAMRKVADSLRIDFAEPLARCADKWKGDNASLEASVTRFTKDGQKDTKRITAQCLKLRKSMDKAVGSGASSNKAVRAVGKLSTAMAEHDRHFSSYLEQLTSFNDASLKAEKDRFNEVIGASEALAKTLNRQAHKRARFGEWLGLPQTLSRRPSEGVPAHPPKDDYVMMGGDDSDDGAHPDDDTCIVVLRGDDGSRATGTSTDEYVDVVEGTSSNDGWKPVFAASAPSTADSAASALAQLVAAEQAAHEPGAAAAAAAAVAVAPVAAATDAGALVLEETTDEGDAVVITPYTARMADELTVSPGNAVRILESADDGWVLACDMTSGEKGWIHNSFVQTNDNAVYCYALRDFAPENAPTALPLTRGERLRVLNKGPTWWLVVRDGDAWDTAVGYAPARFVKLHDPRTPAKAAAAVTDDGNALYSSPKPVQSLVAAADGSASPTTKRSPTAPKRPKRDARKSAKLTEKQVEDALALVDDARTSESTPTPAPRSPASSADESFRLADAAEAMTPEGGTVAEDAETFVPVADMAVLLEDFEQQERQRRMSGEPVLKPRVSSLRRHRFDGTNTAPDNITPPGSLKSGVSSDEGEMTGPHDAAVEEARRKSLPAVAPPPGFS